MASKWHEKIQEKMMEEIEKQNYHVEKEKIIGFDSDVNRKNQFKIVDIVAEKEDEIVLIEIEDYEKETKTFGNREYGVNYVELGGILLLSWLFSKLNPSKNVKLLLTFRENIESFRKKNIERIISDFKEICKPFEIRCRYMH